MHEWKKEFKTNYNNYKQKDFDRTIEDFVDKAEKLGKNVATTTFGIVDKVVDVVGSFIDTNSFNIFGSYKVEERSFELEAVEGAELFIEGTNG
jgi:biotin-(acetyl-CoA carboxylase) ligase